MLRDDKSHVGMAVRQSGSQVSSASLSQLRIARSDTATASDSQSRLAENFANIMRPFNICTAREAQTRAWEMQSVSESLFPPVAVKWAMMGLVGVDRIQSLDSRSAGFSCSCL